MIKGDNNSDIKHSIICSDSYRNDSVEDRDKSRDFSENYSSIKNRRVVHRNTKVIRKGF